MAMRALSAMNANSDEARWEWALQVARELPPLPASDIAWQRRRAALRWAVVAFVVVGLVLVVAERAATGHGVGTLLARHQAELGALAGVALVLVGLAQLHVGARRLGAGDAAALTPAAVLTGAQQRAVWRQVRGADPGDPALLPVARTRTVGPSEAERWEQALSIARGTPTPPALDRQRRRRRSVLLGVVGLLVVSASAGVVVGMLSPDATTDPPHASVRWAPVSIATMLVGLALMITGAVMFASGHREIGRSRSPVTALTRRQRTGVLREVRGRVPADPHHLPVTLDQARRLVATDWVLVAYGGLMIMQLGRLIGLGGQFQLLWTAGFIVFLAVIGALVVRDRRLAARFLDRHAGEAS